MGDVNGSGSTRCCNCNASYSCDDGIWQLYADHEKTDGDVTEKVKQFYEEHPFPNYDDQQYAQLNE